MGGRVSELNKMPPILWLSDFSTRGAAKWPNTSPKSLFSVILQIQRNPRLHERDMDRDRDGYTRLGYYRSTALVVQVVKPGEQPEHVSLRGDLFLLWGKKLQCHRRG